MRVKVKAAKTIFKLSGLVFLLLFFVTACANPLKKDKFVTCGTYLEVTSYAKAAGKIVNQEFNRLDKIFNFYDPDSELSKLNGSYPNAFKASPELIELLTLAEQVYTLTAGAFDVSYGRVYKFWKGLIVQGKISKFPGTDAIARLRQMGGMENIEIDRQTRTVRIKQAGLKIDLSAIAKGYIVDRAVLKLKENGIKSALINAGGDIYCLGKNQDRPWKVGIKNPEEIEEIVETQTLVNEAIATSGGYEQFFKYQGSRYSHLIDPATGLPVKNNILSVSVVTKNCTTADSLATAFFVAGLEGIKEVLAKAPSTMRIIVVTDGIEGKQVHFFK